MTKLVANPTVLPVSGFASDVRDLTRVVQALMRTLATELTNHARRLNLALTKDGTEVMTGPLMLLSSTVVGVPTAATYEGGLIYVSNEAGGKTVAFSDGTNWRRVQDRVIVS